MDDFFFKSLVMNAMQGLLASDCTQDRKYIDGPAQKKEDKLVEDSFKIAMAFAKRFHEMEKDQHKP